MKTSLRIVAALALLGCRPTADAPPPTSTPRSAASPVVVASATATALPEPTATPEPEPTATAEPAAQPALEPTPIRRVIAAPTGAPVRNTQSACAPGTEQMAHPAPSGGPGLRPVIVQIDNAVPARPPLNLSQAHAVYEYVAEGGVTRFSALYTKEDPGIVGPIRSARLASMEIARQFEGLLVYHGASDGVQARIWDGGIYFASLNAVDSFAYHGRVSERPAPHNSIITLPQMRAYAATRGVPPRVGAWPDFPRGDLPNIDATGMGRLVTVGFANPEGAPWPDFRAEFRYSDETGVYSRSIGGVPHVDGFTGQPIVAETVVVQVAPVVVTDIVEDVHGSLSLDYQLQGEGPAYFFRSGQMWQGCWRRPSAFEPTTYLGPDGAIFPFGRGQVWISLAAPNTPIWRE